MYNTYIICRYAQNKYPWITDDFNKNIGQRDPKELRHYLPRHLHIRQPNINPEHGEKEKKNFRVTDNLKNTEILSSNRSYYARTFPSIRR